MTSCLNKVVKFALWLPERKERYWCLVDWWHKEFRL